MTKTDCMEVIPTGRLELLSEMEERYEKKDKGYFVGLLNDKDFVIATLSEKELIENKVAGLLETTRNAFYIGRGQDYYVSMEASLKLKEVSYIQCEGFAAGELKHGTIALIEEGTPVIALIANNAKVAAHTRGNVSQVIARAANVITIVEQDIANADDDIITNNVHPYLSRSSMVIQTQLIAYYASLHRGLDVDKPRNLAKSVRSEEHTSE